MTMLLAMEALDAGKISLDDMITCSEYANSMGGSQIWLKVGEEMSVADLLKAVAIASANDASAALGEYVAGSNDAFVKLMNERAQELGMKNTTFMNATGLDDPGHMTTARDIAVMSRELMKHPIVVEYSTIWMDSLRGGATELVNTNKLVRFYNGATGLKTGTTDGAGSCVAATATRDGLSLISVVMGSPTSNERFASARGLLDFGFANYQSTVPPPVDDSLSPVPVLRGVEGSVMPVYEDPGQFVIEKGKEDEIVQEVTLVEDLEAPVLEGQIVGKVQVLVNGELAGDYDLKAAKGIDRMTFGKAFLMLAERMLRTNRGPQHKPAPKTATPATTGEMQHSPECTCEEGKCHCEAIGDICGCTKTE
jgi:D-alanyl-D-alanine carboxypeptidase (penicillin-binding protein 5/6)